MKIQSTNIQLQGLVEAENKEILEATSTQTKIYVLYKDSTLSEFEISGTHCVSVVLRNSLQIPCLLYVDDIYVYIGYENGTTEILDRFENLNYLKTTSVKDPGGPGDPKITAMIATEDFLLVNTVENGLLIYIKPAILFYKWIMIELETTIVSFTIDKHLLFVLTKDNEIHLLNFNKQRLDELPIGGFEYKDLEFDGRFLYVASKQSVHVYDYENNNKLVYSYKQIHHRIAMLAKFQGNILIILNNNHSSVLQVDRNNLNVDFSIRSFAQSDDKYAEEFYRSIKTKYSNQNLIKERDDMKFIWLHNNKLHISKIF